MDIDLEDLGYISTLIQTLNDLAANTGGYNVNNAEVWYEGDFLGRLYYNERHDGQYTFRAAGLD